MEINTFMGKLAYSYDSETMKALWQAMDDMRERWGDAYIADQIKANADSVELAILRYARSHPLTQEVAPPPAPAAQWVHVDNEKPNWLKRIGIVLGIAMLFAVVAIIFCEIEMDRGEKLLAEATVIAAERPE